MDYQSRIIDFNNLNTAFKLIDGLQKGEEEIMYLLYTLSTKPLLLPSGKRGSIILLAIQMQKFVAAEYLLNNMSVYDSDEVIANSLAKSAEIYNGEETVERLQDSANENETYARMVEEYNANNEALNRLKEIYIGPKRVNK